MTLIDVPQMKHLVHISGMFGAWRGNTSWVAPLAWHPDNRNAVIMVDFVCVLSGSIGDMRKPLYPKMLATRLPVKPYQ
jgi:exonuclease I